MTMLARSCIAGIALLVCTAGARAETDVDRLVARFDELTMTHVGG